MGAPSWSSTPFWLERAGFSIDWASTDKIAYLQALTKNWMSPAARGFLDKYLEPYIRPAVTDLKEHIAAAKGLDGGTGDADKVRGSNDDPAVIAEYDEHPAAPRLASALML